MYIIYCSFTKKKSKTLPILLLNVWKAHRLRKNPNGAVARIRKKSSGRNSLFKENQTTVAARIREGESEKTKPPH